MEAEKRPQKREIALLVKELHALTSEVLQLANDVRSEIEPVLQQHDEAVLAAEEPREENAVTPLGREIKASLARIKTVLDVLHDIKRRLEL